METLAKLLSTVLVPLFFAGMAGSLFVVVLTLVRDLRQVVTSDDVDDGSDL